MSIMFSDAYNLLFAQLCTRTPMLYSRRMITVLKDCQTSFGRFSKAGLLDKTLDREC